MIKAVLLDLGNVVVFFDANRRNPSLALEQFERGGITKLQYRTEVTRQSGKRVPASEFWRVHNDLFTPNAGMIRLLRQLKPGIRLIAFSNTDPVRGRRMIQLSWLRFSAAVMSHIVGAMKPEAPMFEAGIREADVTPSEILYFDDVLEYCDAARKYGIVPHHFRTVELARRELTARGLIA